jgi:subtilase family serine protease
MRTKALSIALFAVLMAAGPVHAAKALPDLIIESVKWEYVSGHGVYGGAVQPGDTIQVNVKVKNIGQAAAGPFRVQLEVRWVEQGIKSVSILKDVNSLAPQASKTEVFKVRHVKFGEYMFTARVDYKNQVEEFDEANNEKIGSNMPVIGNLLQKPDLVVSLSSPDASRHIGRKVLLRGKVENRGKRASNPCKLQLKCEGKKTNTTNVPALNPGHSFKFEFAHRWSTRGKRKCEVWVDSKEQVQEAKEANNKADLVVHIK